MSLKSLNTDALLDIWAELKAKRLAPVAIGLVVALFALPALLLMGSDAPEEAATPVVAPASEQGAQVEVAADLAEADSKLDSYKARNPFKGMDVGGKDASGKDDGTATVPSGGALPTGGSSGGKPGEAPTSGSTGGSTGSSGQSGSTGGATPTPDPVADPPASLPPGERKTEMFNFQLDIKFGRPGQERRYRGLPRTSFLPSKRFPIALFMGVTEDEKRALFFVYPGLNHQGWGRCIPKPTDCNFLELRVGRDHYFSANDREFHMELLDIKRVKATDEKRQIAKASQKRSLRSSGGDVSGTTSSDAERDAREWPFLVDAAG